MSADFTPSFLPYTGQGSFLFWTQKVLPLVYDDSLSYYETLCKVVTFLNNVIKDVDTVEDNLNSLKDTYIELQNYVNSYFENLDVQHEIDVKLDTMAEDGTLTALLDAIIAANPSMLDDAVEANLPTVVSQQIGDVVAEQIETVVETAIGDTVPDAVTSWLEENVDPTGSTTVVIDSSLSISGAAADAGAVGEQIDKIKSGLGDDVHYAHDSAGVYTSDWNISNNNNWGSLGTKAAAVYIPIPNEVYTIDISYLNGSQVGFVETLYDDQTASGDAVDFAPGYSAKIVYNTAGTQTYQVKEGMNYLWVLWKNTSGTNVYPSDIVFNGYYNFDARFDEIDDVLATVLNTTLANATTIPSNTDYNTMLTPGIYAVNTNAQAESMKNCPFTTAHILIVYKPFKGTSRVSQIAINAHTTTSIMIRNTRDASEFRDWERVSANYIPENTLYARKLNYQIAKAETRAKTTADTLLYDATHAYETGDTLNGVIYSGVWRDGQDVFRNLTLETFYSALANPTSVLYTKNYLSKNVSNGFAWYGGVCSTFIAALTNRRLYYTSDYLYANLEDKASQSALDLETGDLYVIDGHEMIVSNLYINCNGALAGSVISELAQPNKVVSSTFRTVDLTAGLNTNYSYKIKVNPNQGEVHDFGDVSFNTKILYERGNNTYITAQDIIADEGVWMYLPDGSTEIIYWKKGNGSWNSLTVSELPSKVVGDYTVRNVASVFSGAGDYQFSHSTSSSAKTCLIKLINPGSITLNNRTLTISGWENCYPYNYYVVVERPETNPATHDNTMNPSNGYYCHFTNKGAEINVSPNAASTTIEIPYDLLHNSSEDYTRYKIWVEYQTGIGLKQAWSNLVDIS